MEEALDLGVLDAPEVPVELLDLPDRTLEQRVGDGTLSCRLLCSSKVLDRLGQL